MSRSAQVSHDRTPHHRTGGTVWDGDKPGSEVVALSTALVLTATTIEVTLAGRVGLFFDLTFVMICLGMALLVRQRDFFTVGVLPPLLLLGTFVIVALNGAKVIAQPHDSVVQAVVTGLAHHSLALFFGYAVCLGTLLGRQQRARRGR